MKKIKITSIPISMKYSKKELDRLISIFTNADAEDLSPTNKKLVNRNFKGFSKYQEKFLSDLITHIGNELAKKPEYARFILPNLITFIPRAFYDSVMDSEFAFTVREQIFIMNIFKEWCRAAEPDTKHIG